MAKNTRLNRTVPAFKYLVECCQKVEKYLFVIYAFSVQIVYC